MSKKVLIITAILPFLYVPNLQAVHYDSNWVGGSWGYWETVSNWDPAIVPENGADTFSVTINGGSGTDISLQQNHTIVNLNCHGKVQFKCWPLEEITLTLTDDVNGLINHDALNLDDTFIIIGNISNHYELIIEEDAEVHGNIVNYGLMEATGDVEIEGSVTNTAGAKALLGDEDSGTSIEGNLTNATGGLIEVESSLNVGGDLDNAGCIDLRTIFKCQIEGELKNSGVLYNKVLISVRMEPAVDVNNSGTIEVNAGGGIIFDCNLVNEPNGVIQLFGGTLAATMITQSTDANFAGFGGITADIVIDPNGIIQLTGPTNIVGDVNIQTNATLEISDGITLVTGHTTNNGTIHMKGGRLIPQGGITNNGNIIWEPGLYNNVADFNLDGAVNLEDFADFAGTWLWQTSWN